MTSDAMTMAMNTSKMMDLMDATSFMGAELPARLAEIPALARGDGYPMNV